MTGADARREPCKACPFRVENHGKKTPDGWYRKSNLARLWGGLKRGENMSCHPTDPNNPVSDEMKALGYREAPTGADVRECIGAITLQQREVMVFQDEYDGDLRAYRAGRQHAMTGEGLMAIMMRATVTWPGEPPMPMPDLNQQVGIPGRLPWSYPKKETA